MKNKKWLLLLIIALPSSLWLILETSTINSYKLNFYGPKALDEKKDTVFYKVSSEFFSPSDQDSTGLSPFIIDEKKYPFYAIMFIKESYYKDSYRLTGLWEYLKYKKEKVGHIPIFIVTTFENKRSVTQENLVRLTDNENVHFLALTPQHFDSLNLSYFSQKPYYIDYSFFVLVDNNRNIRGYYDSRYSAEVKRLVDEYKHLRLKEEKQKIIRDNEIKTNN